MNLQWFMRNDWKAPILTNMEHELRELLEDSCVPNMSTMGNIHSNIFFNIFFYII